MGLFGWIKGWFSKSRQDLFYPKERMIYSYWNGQKVITADPLVLYKKVIKNGPILAINMRVANSPSKDAASKHVEAILQIREIFEVLPVERGGLTEVEAMELLDHFLTYCDAIKKKSNRLPMQSPSTEGSTDSSPEDSPTNNSSDSGSTEKDNSTDTPPQSPTDQQ